MKVRTLLGIALSLTACSESLTGPRGMQPVPISTADYQAFVANAASELEAYIADKESSTSPLTSERRDELRRMVRSARAQQLPPESASNSESVETSSERMEANSEVEAAGIINQFWTDLDLHLKKVRALTSVNIPAVLEFNLSGTTEVGGFEYPISSSKSTAPFPVWWFSVHTDLMEVNCGIRAARGVVATEHTAGWHVKGFGFVPAHKRSSDSDSCEPPRSACDPTLASYDPYEETCSGGSSSGGTASGTQFTEGERTGGETVNWQTGVGNGGSSACGADAVVEWVCIDIEGEDGWQHWSCGYATTC